MVTLVSYDNTEQAELLKARLEQAGIQAFVADGAIITLNWMFSNAVGGVKVQVHEADLERARALLLETVIPPEAQEPLSPYRCPDCGSSKVEFRRLSKGFFLLSLLVLGIPLAFYRPGYKCLNCGKAWKRDAVSQP